jgi:hypothetical protein
MLADIEGRVMWRFKKGNGKGKEIWDEDIQRPIDDIEAAHRIREICRSAADSAEKVAGLAGRTDDKTADNKNKDDRNQRNEHNKYEAERYERAAKAAMVIAMKISDGLMRDASVRQIVNLCVKADDLKTARTLFRAIQAVSIQEEVLNDHPVLRQ